MALPLIERRCRAAGALMVAALDRRVGAGASEIRKP